jgi:hypothetical protein
MDGPDNSICNPIVEITPDWKASICFASKDDFVDLRAFDSLVDLERYLLFKNTYPKTCANNLGRCAECVQYELFQCQGGCLGFADA